jgi:hypothetical protein
MDLIVVMAGQPLKLTQSLASLKVADAKVELFLRCEHLPSMGHR